MKIIISNHAREQMVERGASEEEVIKAILQGESEEAKKGRLSYKKNYQYNNIWRGKEYRIKQVAPIATQEEDKVTVITVYVFYF